MNGFTDIKLYRRNYYLNHRQYILDYRKNNYEINKEKINEKIKCNCGRIIMRRYLKKHLGTTIHNKPKIIKAEPVIEIKEIKKIHDGYIHFK